MKTICYFLLAVLMVSGCKKDDPTPSAPVEWSKITTISNFFEGCINMSTDGNYLYVLSTYNSFTKISKKLQTTRYSISNEHLPNEKPPMNATLNVGISPFYDLIAVYNSNPLQSPTQLYLPLRQLDSNLEIIPVYGGYKRSSICINDKSELLIPYKNKNDNQIHLFLISIDTTNQNGKMDTLYTKKITITHNVSDLLQPGAVINISYVDGYFYMGIQFSSEWATYRIGRDGSYEKVINYSAAQVFKYKNQLYAVCDKNIYISSDNGLTWPSVSSFPLSMSFHHFFLIDGDLFSCHNDELFQVFVTPTDFLLTELANDGIKDVYITTVTTFNNYVVVGGINGVFFIDKVNFRKPKTNG